MRRIDMRTEMTLSLLCDALQKNCGDVLAACKTVGVSLIFVNQWRRDDSKVHEQLLEAERVGVQGLYSAAVERAVKGVPEDVYYKGDVVGTKINYSDGLLNLLLKAKLPDFAKDAEGGGAHVTVNIANVMPRAENYDQWLAMKQKTLAAPGVAIAPPVVDAEFTEVSAFQGIDL